GDLRVAADGIPAAADGGVPEHDPDDEGHHGGEDHRHGDAQRTGLADPEEGLGHAVEGGAVRDDEAQTTHRRHGGQRGHDGRDVQVGHQQAVDHADHQAGDQSEHDRQRHWQAAEHQGGGGGPGQGGGGADGEVEVAGHHHHGLRRGDDRQDGY